MQYLLKGGAAGRCPLPSSSLEWQVFHFLKGQILRFSVIVIIFVFCDFTQRFWKNVISESAEISMVGLPYTTLIDKL